MRLRRTALLLLLTAPFATRARAQATACAPARTALVLAGGAAKGFAHVGVLRVLDSIGVRPDLIVGTSMGAVVGSLYASGYTAHEVDSSMRALPFETVIRRYEPIVSQSLGLLKALAVWEKGRTGYRLQAGAVREGEINALISALTLRGNLAARGRFDSLAIPFRAVATDLVSRQPVVVGDGDLAFAVRASVALPLLFQPVQRDSTWLIDGGLSANAPVSQARALGATRVWVSRLPHAPPDRNAYDDPLALTLELVNSLFKEDSTPMRPGDVEILNPTHNFDVLDFRATKSDSLIRLGYNTARTAFGAASCLKPLGPPGSRLTGTPPSVGGYANGSPATRVGSVVATSTGHDEAAVLADLGVAAGRPIDRERMKAAIVELGRSERIRALWLNPHGSGSEVSFTPELEPAPRRTFGVGVAFDHFMSGRFWVGGVDRLAFNKNAEAAVIARFGAWEQDLEGFLRVHANVGGRHLSVGIGARATHASVRRFTATAELPNAETDEGEVFVGMRDDPEPGAWRYEAMTDVRVWREPGNNTKGSAGIRAAIFNARNDYEMGTMADAIILTDFQRLRVDASRIVPLGVVQARVHLRAGWGNRLPIQHSFTLGGPGGFAGLRIGDIRGSQEAYGALQLRRRIAPALDFLVEGMVGAMGSGYGVLVRRDSTDMGRVYSGARVGIEATTPIGPIRVEQGFNNAGARALLVRVGYWF